MMTSTTARNEGKIFWGGNPIAQRKSFPNPRDAIDFAVSLLSRSNSGERDASFFELEVNGNTIILQCQKAGCFLQFFCSNNDFEGWLTALRSETVADDLDIDDDELVMPCYDEDDEPRDTHFRLIGVEGTWISNQLLVSKEQALVALGDIYRFEVTGVWDSQSAWIDLGIL